MTGKEMAKILELDDPVFSKGSHTLFDDEDYDVSKLIPKVKIPKFVANYIEYCKNCYTRAGVSNAMDPNYMNDDMPDKVVFWLANANGIQMDKERQELFARAWLYGYEIEEEAKYVLPLEGTMCMAVFEQKNKRGD